MIYMLPLSLWLCTTTSLAPTTAHPSLICVVCCVCVWCSCCSFRARARDDASRAALRPHTTYFNARECARLTPLTHILYFKRLPGIAINIAHFYTLLCVCVCVCGVQGAEHSQHTHILMHARTMIALCVLCVVCVRGWNVRGRALPKSGHSNTRAPTLYILSVCVWCVYTSLCVPFCLPFCICASGARTARRRRRRRRRHRARRRRNVEENQFRVLVFKLKQ